MAGSIRFRHEVRKSYRWLLGWFAPLLAVNAMISYRQYRSVNIYTGEATYFTVDSLSAFWPGLQVLAGDVKNAIKSHLMCEILCVIESFTPLIPTSDWNLWRRHSGLPEVWDTTFRQATSLQYPLRPGRSVLALILLTYLTVPQNLLNRLGTCIA